MSRSALVTEARLQQFLQSEVAAYVEQRLAGDQSNSPVATEEYVDSTVRESVQQV